MEWISADEAAGRLGIRKASLYSYVSRGLVRSEADSGGRARRYSREDVDALALKQRERKDPSAAVRGALHWGVPVLESGLSVIADGHLTYRGRDALELARTRSFEQVVSLLWTGDLEGALPDDPAPEPACWDTVRELSPVQRFTALVALASAADLAAWDLREAAVKRTGMRILRLLFGAAAGKRKPTRIAAGTSLAGALASGWGSSAAALIERALILCADHELNVSAFTARCVASAQASPYGAVLAGLAALQGTRHGGSCERVEALYDAVERPSDARAVVSARMRHGEPLVGFGHPLYPDGDPRARFLLASVAAEMGGKAMKRTRALVDAVGELAGEAPNVDLALVALARACELPPGASVALFALGRTAGWLAHAMEQYRDGRLIRPRARPRKRED